MVINHLRSSWDDPPSIIHGVEEFVLCSIFGVTAFRRSFANLGGAIFPIEEVQISDYYSPYNPCEVYLPTLTKKNQLNVGKYMQIYTI